MSQIGARGIKKDVHNGARWLGMITLLSAVVGSFVALFLALLERVTLIQEQTPWLLFGLPLAGVGIVLVYKRWGKGSESGHDLLIEDLTQDQDKIPRRMAPLIFGSTILTHLFGGSAGREGTAVQLGGSLAHTLALGFRLDKASRNLLILCGMAAGFGAVFGTPVTGAVFVVELMRRKAITPKWTDWGPIVLASYLGDFFCALWPIQHTVYRIEALAFDLTTVTPLVMTLGKLILIGAAFGLCSLLFTQSLHGLKKIWALLPQEWIKPLVGGGLVIFLCHILQTRAYLGLGVMHLDAGMPSILRAFEPGGVPALSWFWKLLFTLITLSSGFKGGEATPLFFIGACLGSTLSPVLGLPADFAAGLGFVAVFAAATETPWAGSVMAGELFGLQQVPLFALVCCVAFLVTSGRGLYRRQRPYEIDPARRKSHG